MENLTKQQLVLLAVLVSFVTSIATGILTVVSLQETRPTVTQTINRVVERTIERVAPVTDTKVPVAGPGKTIVERETVIVKEDELVPASVERNGAAIVRIMRKGTEAGAEEKLFSLGLIVGRVGTVLAPHFSFDALYTFEAVLSDGKRIPLGLATATPEGVRFSLLSLLSRDSDPHEFSVAAIGDTRNIRLGQTVIGIGGRDRNSVSVGIVSTLDRSIGEGVRPVSAIDTSLDSQTIFPGAPLITLSGEVIGLRLSDDRSGVFIPIDEARKAFGF